MSLRLIQCLTYDIPNCIILKSILKEIPIEIIQPMSKSSEPEMRNTVKDILDNLNRARKQFENKPTNEVNKCGRTVSVEAACGGQNCQAREPAPPPCPAATKNFTNNKCFYIQNSS
ncbi:hypothetical protein L9F63_015753 [Diploptera punctata]|uniref:Uncharacterized protein n=1 Tax=Diploptera punctata TaxID=6984 RepID=A0AAD8A594_DIPPU|nr:hypothetical protein L9F63_015753 [Diploptera punctata]